MPNYIYWPYQYIIAYRLENLADLGTCGQDAASRSIRISLVSTHITLCANPAEIVCFARSPAILASYR